MKIELNDYHILMGDRNVLVCCKMPYQGWRVFKSHISNILGLINETKIIQYIQRYSMKYVDLLEPRTETDRINQLQATISIGQYTLNNQVFSLRVEIPHEEFLNIVNISSSEQIIVDHIVIREGIIVETDTIFTMPNEMSFSDWYTGHREKIENIHLENNRMFFNSLKSETIQALEPE